MKVRLTRKFSPLINGVDLSKFQKGDTLDLPAREASMLVAEGWAEPEMDRAHDRPPQKRKSRAKASRKKK